MRAKYCISSGVKQLKPMDDEPISDIHNIYAGCGSRDDGDYSHFFQKSMLSRQ